MHNRGRFVRCVLACFVLMTTIAVADENPPAEFERVVRPFLKSHCYACHGPGEQQSRIRYDQLNGFVASDRHLWTLVYEQLSAGAMPPEDRPRPAEQERNQILRWIESQQRLVAPLSVRRLNRRELAAALQDVTGLAVDFAYTLPGDGKVDGFDTGADGLQDSADALAQVMQVTRRAVDGIRILDPPHEKVFAADVRNAKDLRKVFDDWKADGLSANTGDVTPQVGLGWLIKPKWLEDRGGLTIRMPPRERRGILRVCLDVSVKKFVAGVPNPHLWVEVGGRELAFPEISNSPEKPRTLIYEVPLSEVTSDAKGVSVTLTNRVEVPYAIDGFENEEKSKPEDNVPGGTGLFRPSYDARTLPLEQQPIPLVVLHRFELAIDHRAAWPPSHWKADMGQVTDDRRSAERLLQLWIDRAWRRPVPATEQARFLALYDTLRAQGESFDEAVRSTFQAVLLAGSFRYLVAPNTDPASSQHAVASRLSFMLWGSPPDNELRNLARDGKLTDPQVLDSQVNRLLSDPRSDAFVRPFVTQWLEMGQPITVAMDHIQKQDFRFGRNLKASMQEETIAYFAQLLAENRPASELIASDWTMLNDILARHYGYEGINGGGFRKMTLRSNDPRGGGVLGQAGIQSMLCWMGDNWVIYRGAWLARRILDDPPQPAPLEVPELIPSDSKNRGKTFKQLLQQHQADPKCFVCHRKIDSLGFAFQNFDLSGRWRDVEHDHYVTKELDGKIEWHGAGATRPVDAAGQLPRGEKFENYRQCQDLLMQHYTPDIVRGLLKNLLLYGAGRKADVDDLAEIQAIVQQHQKRGYPVRDLVHSLVKSRAFLQK